MATETRALVGYLALALFVTASAWGGDAVLGHPDVDVWNHVWGYWFVADALGSGQLPWRTDWIGAPGGGTLFFVDLPGAMLGAPVTWLADAAQAYDLVLTLRVAAAGFFAHLLCGALTGPGRHALVAGVAYATTPFIFRELANGISEVAATWWIPAAFWAAVRAFDGGGAGRWALLGAIGGACVWANFYYAATAGLLVAAWWAARSRNVRGAAIAAAVAAVVGAPAFWAMHTSVRAPDALVRRESVMNAELLAHNAVDPRVYFLPGDFQSVDLESVFGEPFRHSGYLRWSVLALAAWAVWKRRELRVPAGVAVLSLALGLGPYLYWGGDWVRAGDVRFSLPFGWLQKLIPDLAVTHPLRLCIGAQAIACALAGAALVGRPRWVPVAAAAAVLETVLASAARWPVPASPTAVPDLYARIAEDPDPRAVLDLPPELGTTMATSRYFWYQTVHRHPIPYEPDARAGTAGDPDTFSFLPGGPQPGKTTRPIRMLRNDTVAHIREVYGWVVLHADIAARIPGEDQFTPLIERAFGAPTVEGNLRWWRLDEKAAFTDLPSGTVGLLRISTEGRPQVLFPSVSLTSPGTLPPPPRLTHPLRTPTGEPVPESGALAWYARCEDDGGLHYVPALDVKLLNLKGDDAEILGLVVVGEPAVGTLPPPREGETPLFDAPGIARVDEHDEGTRFCTSDVDRATVLVTPAGRFSVGCCGP